MLKGIDISNWQGAVNYEAIKTSADFIIVKATESNTYVDKYLTRNQSEARRVGMLLGYYHFARPAETSPELQADYLLSAIGPMQNGEVLVLDYEVDFPGDTDAWCFGFLERIKAKTGIKPLIYLNQSLANQYKWARVLGGDYGLWLAQYDGSPDGVNATPWPTVAMKQYTSNGAISGVGGNVDLDSFFGDADTFKKYGYQGSPMAANEGIIETQGLPAHNEPNLSSSWEWYYDYKEHVTLLSKVVGEFVPTGLYAPSRYWYQTDKGWVSDAYVTTAATPPLIPDYVAPVDAPPIVETPPSNPPVVETPPAAPEEPTTPTSPTTEGKDDSVPKPGPVVEGSKETVRTAILGGISYLLSLGLNYLTGLPETQVTVILTLILKGIDKYVHENPNINLKGILPF